MSPKPPSNHPVTFFQPGPGEDGDVEHLLGISTRAQGRPLFPLFRV